MMAVVDLLNLYYVSYYLTSISSPKLDFQFLVCQFMIFWVIGATVYHCWLHSVVSFFFWYHYSIQQQQRGLHR